MVFSSLNVPISWAYTLSATAPVPGLLWSLEIEKGPFPQLERALADVQ